MPINAHPDFIIAEGEYLHAQNLEEKIEKLRKMISLAPAHKGAENLRAQLKLRLKKFLEKQNKEKKSKRSSKKGIKKEDMQAVIIGLSNSGKSSLLSSLTNVKNYLAKTQHSTTFPVVGMMPYQGTQIQLIENPPLDSENYDKGLTNSADTLLILISSLEDIKTIEKNIEKFQGKKIIVFNKIDLLDQNEKRKIYATLQSKKYNFVLISAINKEGIEELKEKIFKSFDKIRVFTKEPGKEKSPKPVILNPKSTVKDSAEKILKGFSSKVKETKIWGPSSKFPGQKVGLNHILKDLDVVEFKTR
jgi:uncharacterized protein